LTPDDERNRAEVVVLTDTLWRQRFNADPAIVSRSIALDGKAWAVVGILRPDFRLPGRNQSSAKVDAFVPLRINTDWVGEHNDEAVGRLRAGVTLAQAQAELDVLQSQVGALATREAHEPVTLASIVTPLNEVVVGTARRGLLLLFGAIGAVLLIACSNLASLSLTRATGRLRESAIRSALGASRSRLIARTLLEQLILSIAGGGLGVWVAWAALAVFVRTAPVDLPRLNEVALDARVLIFAAAVALLTAMLVAVLPALRTASRGVQAALRAGGAAVASDRGGVRTRATLLALQVGLSVVLLVVTGLLSASFLRVLNADRGFDADRVLAVDIALPAIRYGAEPVRRDAYDRMLAAVRELPGVRAATTLSALPMTGSGQVNGVVPDGATGPRSDYPTANFRFVAPDFFQTLTIPLRQGRSFTDAERDRDRPAPVVVSEPLAARLWPGRDPIGKRFSRGLGAIEQGFEVVGVATDARLTSLDRTPPLMVYVPYWWRSRASVSLLVKTASDPASAIPMIRRAIHGVDPDIAVGESRPLDDLLSAALAGRRYQAQLFVVFGAAAMLIAMIGVYAVTAYGVSRRRRELNIRVALGAQVSQVRALIMKETTRPLVAGAAGGILGAVALGGAVASLLFDVRARDPLVIAAVTAFVVAVGVLSALTAVRRSLRVDPAAALREE